METPHVLTCLSGSPANEKVVRLAASLAQGIGAIFTALYVEPAPGGLPKGQSAEVLQNNILLAEKLGAHVATVYGGDMATQVAEYARLSGVSHIVLGRSGRLHFFRNAPQDRLARMVPEIQLCVVPYSEKEDDPLELPRVSRPHISWPDTGRCLGVVLLCTLLGGILGEMGLEMAIIGQVYILGVLAIGVVTTGWVYGLMGPLLSALAFTFLYVPPLFSFRYVAPGYPVTFLVMLVVGLITSNFTLRVRGQALTAADKAWRTEVLLRHAALLQRASSPAETLDTLCAQLEKLVAGQVRWYQPNEQGELMGPTEDKNEEEAALWAWQHRSSAGATTGIRPEARRLYLPVMGQRETYAVVGLTLDKKRLPEPFVRNLLGAMVDQCGLALEKYSVEKDRDAAQHKAEQEKLRANLLRSISHDLRTPLTSICGSAGILRESGEALKEERRKELYNDIYDDALWLIDLVENLLAVTRIENGTMQLHMEPQLVEDIFAEATEHLDRHAGEHVIETRLPVDLLMAEMDSRLIVQVLVNLLNNAIKYTPPGSHILLTARSEGQWVRFAVADDGPGIPEKERGKLFEMFYTAGKRRGDSRRGMGLGLSLCRSIVRAHGGEITMEPNQPHGSIFTFTLKRKEAADLEPA